MFIQLKNYDKKITYINLDYIVEITQTELICDGVAVQCVCLYTFNQKVAAYDFEHSLDWWQEILVKKGKLYR